jgi:hypothetical protein
MDQERSGGISSTGIVLIVLACLGLGVLICAGVIIVCLVAITALGTSANKTFGTVRAPMRARPDYELAVMEFLDDLDRGDTRAAWGKTNEEFQQGHLVQGEPIKYFDNLLQEHPGLKTTAETAFVPLEGSPVQQTIQATVTSRSEEITILTLTLKRESGSSWKVSDLSVGEEAKDNPPAKAKKKDSKSAGKEKS